LIHATQIARSERCVAPNRSITAPESGFDRLYGTLITVFTMVVDASNASTLPLMMETVADVECAGLDTVIPG
jgi:hypothetical protein